jgi:dsDNA-binding SOS-regulon protein
MSNEVEHFLETQDEAVSLLFLENKSDELTDILVAALEDALQILSAEFGSKTVH